MYIVGLESSDSESSSSGTDGSDNKSDGSLDTDTDIDTEEEDFDGGGKKPVRAKQKGRAVYIYMYIMYMLLAKACHHNKFVWACITIQSFFDYTQMHYKNNILMPIYFVLILFNFGRVLVWISL